MFLLSCAHDWASSPLSLPIAAPRSTIATVRSSPAADNTSSCLLRGSKNSDACPVFFGSRAGIVGVYQRHEYADEKRAALERWADHVDGLIHGRTSNVVNLSALREGGAVSA
jgi:hypothetical protein